MKKFLLIILFVTVNSYSQSIERQVIGATGATYTDDATVSMDFTIGELLVTTITDGTTTLTQGFHQGDVQLSINLSAVAYLQGAFLNPNTGEESLMRDDLRLAGLIPTTSPYLDGVNCNPSVFTTTGNNAIVDWIWVELRDESTNTQVLHNQSALLQRDGDVVAIDGISSLSFKATSGNYFVVIKHRNHLGMMSSTPIELSNTTTVLNFTEANNQITYGNNAQTINNFQSNKMCMWAGNTDGNTQVRYQGSGNDSNRIKDQVLTDLGNTSNSNLYSFISYNTADVNLNGTIRYQGSGNDSNIIKDIILSHPNNQSSPSNLFIIMEQLPEN